LLLLTSTLIISNETPNEWSLLTGGHYSDVKSDLTGSKILLLTSSHGYQLQLRLKLDDTMLFQTIALSVGNRVVSVQLN
jgi:hypothetical protein